MAGEDSDAVALLTQALRRHDTLELLASDGPLRKGEIDDRVAASRSTVHRTVTTLEDVGLARETTDGFVLTELGGVMTALAGETLGEVDTAAAVAPLLESVRESGFEYDFEAFTDANVTIADLSDPFGPVNRMLDLIQDCSTLKVTSTRFPPNFFDDAADAALDAADAEVVVRPTVVEQVLSEFPDAGLSLYESDDVTLRVHDEVDLGIGIVDDRMYLVELIAMSQNGREHGHQHVMLDTDDPEAVAWAESVFDAYREDAALLDDLDF